MISTSFKRRMLCVLLTTSSLCVPVAVRAQIAAADGATTVYTNPNAVPVVDIAAPNAGGLSHNRFTDYNVDARGLVLNNGPADVAARQSQLAGQVLANTKLGRTAATVILNEVVSTNRSTLNGFTEVLGGAADVIVANPYGITCGGCGFLNAPNVILTTGKPQIGADGRVAGFAVTGGDLVVTGAGLNATGQDYLALLARRVVVQGAVNGKAVDVVGGAHDFDLATRTARARTGTGDTPLYAIDSSVLGGMYTNRIRLIVTEAGAGVRMAGDMAATGGDFTLDAAGQVELSGSLSASGAIRAATSGAGLALSGATITAGEGFALDAAGGTVALTGGAISAGRDIAVTAARLSDAAAATGGTRVAKSIALTVSGAGTVTGTTWSTDGTLSGNLGSLALSGGTLSGASVVLTAAGDLGLAKAALRAVGAATLTAGGVLGIDGTVQSTGGDIALSGGAGVTQSGALSADGGGVTITSRGAFAAAGTLQATRSLSVTAGDMDVGGTLLAGGALSAAATGALANRGTLQAGGQMTLAAASARNTGTVTGTAGLALTSAGVVNAADGVIQSGRAIALAGLGTLLNDGRIVAGTDLSLAGTTAKAAAVTNGGSGVLQAANALSLTSGGALAQSGKVLATDVALNVASARNAGVIQGDATLAITSAADIANTGLLLGRTSAALTAASTLTNAANVQANRLTLVAATLDNTGAVKGGASLAVTAGGATNSGLLTADSVDLAVGALSNAATSTIKAATGDLRLTDARLIGNAGLMLAARNLTTATSGATRTALTNSASGVLQAGSGLALTGLGMLTQTGGLFGATIAIDAADASNTGLIQSSGAIDATVAGTLANSGTLAGAGAVGLAAATVTNSAAISGGSLTVGATGAIGNAGTLYTDGVLTLTAATLTNESAGGIQGSAGATLTAATVANAGRIVAAAATGGTGTIVAGAIANTGSIASAGSLNVTLSETLSNSGLLLAQSALAIDAAASRAVTVTNQTGAGAIKAGTALRFGGAGTLAVTINGGLLSGDTVTGTLAALTNVGVVQGVHGVTLATTGEAVNGGMLIAGETLALSGSHFANTGLVQTNGTGTLTFGTLDNSYRIYGMGTALAVDAGRLTNAGGATVYSARGLSLTAAAAIDNGGSLLAGGALTLGASGTDPLVLTNRQGAEIQATGALTVSGANGGVALIQDGVLAGASLALALDRYRGAGLTMARGAFALSTAKGATNSGLLHASGVLTVGGTSFTNTGEVSADTSDVAVGAFANTGLFTGARNTAGAAGIAAATVTNSGTVQSKGGLALRLATSLSNTGDVIAAGALDVLATGTLSVDNRADAAVAGKFGLLQAGTGLTITSGATGATASLTSNAGSILGRTVTLGLQSLASAGTIQGDTAVQVTAAGAVANAGTLLSTGTLAVIADSFANTGGVQGAAGTTIGVKGAVDNTGGTIRSAGAAEIDAARLNNSGLISADGALVLDGLNGGAIAVTNAGTGVIQSLDTLRVGAASGVSKSTFSLTGGTVYADEVTLNLDTLANSGGLIQSNGALSFAGRSLRNGGTMLALGRSTITATDLRNDGTFDSNGAATVTADTVSNSGVLVLARTDVGGTISARRLTNGREATLYGKGEVTLRIDEALENSGSIFSEGRLRVLAVAGNGLRINNDGDRASIYSARAIELGTQSRAVDLQTGSVSELIAGGDLTVRAGAVKTKGLLQSGGTLQLTATSVDNDATLVGIKRLTMDVAKDVHNSGVVQAGSARITADTITNAAKGTLYLATENGALAELGAATITNDGWVQSAGNLQLSATRLVDNGGRLLASNAIDIVRRGTDAFSLKLGPSSVVQAASLKVTLPGLAVTNAGQVLVDRLDLTLGSLTNAGVLQAMDGAQIQLGAGAFTNSGTVYSGGVARLRAGGLSTVKGSQVQAVGGLDAVIGVAVNNEGVIFAGQDADPANRVAEVRGALTLTAASIRNAGTLASIGKEDLRVSGTIINADGATIYGKGDVTIAGTGATAATLANASKATIYAGGTLDVSSTADRRIAFADDVSQGVLYGGNLNIAVGQLTNKGVLQADRAGTLTLDGAFTNLAGGLVFLGITDEPFSGGYLSAGSISNAGTIQSNGSLLMGSRGSTFNESGAQMIAGRSFSIVGLGSNPASPGTLDNNGLMQAGGALTIAGAAGTRFGSVGMSGAKAKIIAGSASLKVAGLTLGKDASISTSGATTVDATTLAMTTATSRIIGGSGDSSVTVAGELDMYGALYADGNMAVRATGITNWETGALAAGGTLDLKVSNFVANKGTIFAGNLKVVADGYFQNEANGTQVGGTVDTTGNASIITPEFANSSNFNIGGDLFIDAGTMFNQITGGDTRQYNYDKDLGFREKFDDTDHDPRRGADGDSLDTTFYTDDHGDPLKDANGKIIYIDQHSMRLDDGQSEMDYGDDAFKKAGIAAAVDGTWKSTKTEEGEDNYDNAWNYVATFDTRFGFADPTELGPKPQLLAKGTITIANFDKVRNLGGTISAGTIVFNTSRDGASITNDALATTTKHWKAEWNHYRDCNSITGTNCEWTYYRSYNRWVESTTVTSLGATVSAATITTIGNVELVQNGEGYGVATPKNVNVNTTTRSQEDAVAAADAANVAAAPTGSKAAAGSEAKDLVTTAPTPTQTVAASTAVTATPTGAGLTTTAAQNLKDISTVESAVVGVRVDIGAVTNAGTIADRLNDLADLGPRGQIILNQEKANAAALPQSPLTAVTASDGRVSLAFDGVSVPLPTSPNARFVAAVDPKASYLVESNPIYGIGSNAFSSDFIAQRLGLNVDVLQRRLGDAAYETFLVTQQVIAQTGAAAIVRAETTDQQYARLMVQALAQAGEMGLVYGRALTAAQVAELKADMVWMVLTEVKGQKVLAPVVYLSAATKALLDPKNANVAGNTVDMSLSALTNNGGRITGSTSLNLQSVGDVVNRSGTITGGNVSVISTAGSIINQTTAITTGGKTLVAPTATITATKALTLDAAKDIAVRGATVNAGTDATLKAGHDIVFSTVDRKSTTAMQDGSSRSNSTSIEQIGSTLNVGGNASLSGGRDVTFKASDANIVGNADVTTGRNFNILAGQNSTETTTNTFSGRNVSSNFNVGGDATVNATGDMTVQGSNVNVVGNAEVNATSVNILQGNDVDRSTTTTDTVTYLRTSGSGEGKKSADAGADASHTKIFSNKAGAQAGAKAGITGKGDLEVVNKTTEVTTEEHSKAVGSSFNVGGNAVINATKDVTLKGSTIDATGDVDINAANINLLAAENRDVVTTTTTSNSVGLMTESANEAEAKAKADASQNFTLQAKATAGVKAESDNTVDLYRNQASTTTQTDITHSGSLIKSGGSTSLTATKTLNVQGSSIDATKDVNLKAKDMTFGAVDDVHETTTTTRTTGAGLYGNANGEAKAGGNANLLGAKVGASASAEGSAGVQVKNVMTSETVGSTQAITSSIHAGGNMTRSADNKITDVGTTIEAGGNFTQSAAEWENRAARDTTYSTKTEQTDKARLGAYADADAGSQASVGKAGESGKDTGASLGGKLSYSHEDSKETENTGTARVSTIVTGGNFSSTTSGKTSLEGTDILARKDASLTAGTLDVTAARNTQDSTGNTNKGEGSAKVGIDAAKAVKASGEISYEGEQGKSNDSQAVAGQIRSDGNLTLKTTTGDANFEGTKLQSKGDALVDSAGSVNMTAARDTTSKTLNKEEAKLSGSATGQAAGVELEGGFSHDKATTDKAQVGSATSGGTLTIKAVNDVTLEGTRTDSLGKTTLDAGGNLNLNAAKDTETKESYGAEISASAERTKTPPKNDGADAGGGKSKDTGDGPRIGTRADAGTPSKPGDAAAPSKPGDAAGGQPTGPKWTPASPSGSTPKPGDAPTPSTTPQTGDANAGGTTTQTWTPASPSGVTPVTVTPRSGDGGSAPATPAATPKTGDAGNGQSAAPAWTPATPTTTSGKTPASPTSTTPGKPAPTTPANTSGDASGNGGTQPTPPAPTTTWTKTTPTETKTTNTPADANGGTKPGNAPKPPEGSRPTPSGEGEGKGSGLSKGPEWDESGGANGAANYQTSTTTTATGSLMTSGDGVSLSAGGDITKENTGIAAPTETKAGGETKTVTVKDKHSGGQYGGDIGGQTTGANSGAGTTDTVK